MTLLNTALNTEQLRRILAILLVSRIAMDLMVPASLNVEGYDVEAEVFAFGGEQPLRHLRSELVVEVLSRLHRLKEKSSNKI